MWSWLSELMEGIGRVVKLWFGMDSPRKDVVNEAPPIIPPPDVDRVLDELGVRRHVDRVRPDSRPDDSA